MTGLAVDSNERSPLFPDLPTLAENGAGTREYSPIGSAYSRSRNAGANHREARVRGCAHYRGA